MPSPFPGMDPYIEACGLWEDFHNNLIASIAVQLADIAPQRYVVRTGERSYLVLVGAEGKDRHPFLPDVGVTTPRGRKKASKKGGTALAEPAVPLTSHVLRAFIDEEHRETFIEIYETDPETFSFGRRRRGQFGARRRWSVLAQGVAESGVPAPTGAVRSVRPCTLFCAPQLRKSPDPEMRLVTSIEVLSPSNKRPGTPGWDLYQRKRQSVLLGDVNLVEIDLLRGGTRMPMLDPWPDCLYTLMVARARKPQACRVWEGHFREPLPPIPVPLAKPDADLPLSLQPLCDTIYRRFRYEQSIRYGAELTPPLGPEDAAWCRRRLQSWTGA